ncbi:hypothetical protein TI04_11880 [Achromatium sp. WMS2]|nr:hypothetical protein TI04_11880 [Achromatium sp. WMS2]
MVEDDKIQSDSSVPKAKPKKKRKKGVKKKELRRAAKAVAGEDGEGVNPGFEAFSGKSSGPAHHILFCHAHGDESIWVSLAKKIYFAGCC